MQTRTNRSLSVEDLARVGNVTTNKNASKTNFSPPSYLPKGNPTLDIEQNARTNRRMKRSDSNLDQTEKSLFIVSPLRDASKNAFGSMTSNWKWTIDDESDPRRVLTTNFDGRKWTKTNPLNDNWNLFWATHRSSVIKLFDGSIPLRSDQFVNHFPNYHQLSRKDLMAQNWKKYHDSNHTKSTELPVTYVLPQEYHQFQQNFKHNRENKEANNVWILKPCDRSKGIGIELIDSLDQVPSFLKPKSEEQDCDESSSNIPNWSQSHYVISSYVSNPFLLEGKKFDIRMYVLVLAFKPKLVAFVSNDGFTRICSSLYTNDKSKLHDKLVHLTNVTLQHQQLSLKNRSEGVNRPISNETSKMKWSLNELTTHVAVHYGEAKSEGMMQNIRKLIWNSLSSVQDVIHSPSNSFELFGYDVLIDDHFNAHLMEVNGSPSLHPTDEEDFYMKQRLIGDSLDLLLDYKMNGNLAKSSGSFELLSECI